MKKLIVLIGILVSMYLQVSAEEHGVFMEINMRNRDSYTKVNRAPKYISLDVVYDTETKTVTITGNDTNEVEVVLYNSLGEVEDSSSSLNSRLMITTSGSHRILIESEDWIAEGFFEA